MPRTAKINIIDTPGHADFGGEVERGLSMVDGAVLLVDAAEGPLPQTRFVLEKALLRQLPLIVVINKIDRSDARAEDVLNEVYDLLLELSPDERMLEVPVFYANGRDGRCGRSLNAIEDNMHSLLDAILTEIPAPSYDDEEPFQMLVSDLSYSDFLGRLAVGKVINGSAVTNDALVCVKEESVEPLRVTRIQAYDGPVFSDVPKAESGDIIVLAGVDDVSIGDTICTKDEIKALPRIEVDEPTMSMLFCINNSPFFGREGKFVTSRHLKERLDKELEKNLALRVKPGPNADSFIVYGRGVLHLSVLIETMRREGFELQVGQPKVLDKTINGVRCEPIENLTIEVPEEFVGKAIEISTRRKAALIHMENRGDRTHLDFDIPARGLMGLRSNLLTATQGEAVVAHRFKGYEPYKGDIERRTNGSLVSLETGVAVAYSMDKLQDRGRFFVEPGDEIYAGQVVGEHTREKDLNINICKTKKLTNMRASGSDDKVMLPPPIVFSLEEALEYIQEDELVEVTPKSMRIRKIILDEIERKRKSGNLD